MSGEAWVIVGNAVFNMILLLCLFRIECRIDELEVKMFGSPDDYEEEWKQANKDEKGFNRFEP